MKRQLSTYSLKRRFIQSWIALPLVLSAFGCQRYSEMDASELDMDDTNVFVNSRTQSSVIPNSVNAALATSSLSSIEKAAITNIAKAINNTLPEKELNLGADVLAEAARLKKEEERGRNMALQRVVLITQIVKRGSAMIASLRPRPGLDMRGIWKGSTCGLAATPGKPNSAITAGTLTITMSGEGISGPYSLSGQSTGQIGCDERGRCVAQGNPWGGEIFNTDGKGTGSYLFNARYSTRGDTCRTAIRLVQSLNDRRKKHVELVRQYGDYLRKAAMVISPDADPIFESFGDDLSLVVRKQLLRLQ